MKLIWRTFFGLVLALGLMATTAAADTSLDNEVENYLAANNGSAAEPTSFRVYFKDGIKMESGDGNFTFHIRGRMFFDADWRDDDEDVSNNDGIRNNHVGFKTIRLGAEGTMYKGVIYKLEVSFADGDFDFESSGTVVRLADVYIGLANVGGGTLLFGHMKQAFSIGEMTSSRYTTFIARAGTVEAFAPGRNSGIQWFANFTAEKKLHLAVGVFNRTNTEGNVQGNGGTGFNVRVAGLAIENADKDMILEIGFSLLWQNLRKNGQQVGYGARPGTSLGAAAIGVDGPAEDELRWGFEIAFKIKSFHAQAEFYQVDVSAIGGGDDPSFNGWYVQIGYFITGESRSFRKDRMVWTRVHPTSNFWTGEGGKGAHEIAFRYDMVDLSDTNDGELTTYSFGWNWYWNGNARMMVNYVFSDLDNTDQGTGNINAVIIRWQFDF
jgi:phosphate-selective porin OprO/OprP